MFKLPKLPYERNALEPHISEETIDFHYWKHNKAYVDNLNKLTVWSGLDNDDIIDVITNSKGWVFNNAAQIYNHKIYWDCMSWNGGGEPNGKIAELIKKDFWNFKTFKDLFTEKGVTNFGSWWTWLIQNPEWKLEILNTSNAETVANTEHIPLIALDVWEHSYYIDTRNDRVKYITNFWNVINWDFVNENLVK